MTKMREELRGAANTAARSQHRLQQDGRYTFVSDRGGEERIDRCDIVIHSDEEIVRRIKRAQSLIFAPSLVPFVPNISAPERKHEDPSMIRALEHDNLAPVPSRKRLRRSEGHEIRFCARVSEPDALDASEPFLDEPCEARLGGMGPAVAQPALRRLRDGG
ncbi:hypothetical protein RRF57_000479 [Xylaria bambusicola]|uniref:Uncharacterized protein n=1 Tax=Xylaria bambusicola TaxID=326684 RepID=A0AAN7UA75_9PEZI